jgi:hypothetical protein
MFKIGNHYQYWYTSDFEFTGYTKGHCDNCGKKNVRLLVFSGFEYHDYNNKDDKTACTVKLGSECAMGMKLINKD